MAPFPLGILVVTMLDVLRPQPSPLFSCTFSEPARFPHTKRTCHTQYPHSVRGALVRRYKRFLADVVLGDTRPTFRTSGGGDDDGSGCAGDAAPCCRSENKDDMDGNISALGATECDSIAITCHCPNTGPMPGLLSWYG